MANFSQLRRRQSSREMLYRTQLSFSASQEDNKQLEDGDTEGAIRDGKCLSMASTFIDDLKVLTKCHIK